MDGRIVMSEKDFASNSCQFPGAACERSFAKRLEEFPDAPLTICFGWDETKQKVHKTKHVVETMQDESAEVSAPLRLSLT